MNFYITSHFPYSYDGKADLYTFYIIYCQICKKKKKKKKKKKGEMKKKI